MPRPRGYPGPDPSHCPRCNSSEVKYFALMAGKPRWNCGGCGRHFGLVTLDTTENAPPTLGRYLRRLRRQAKLRTLDMGRQTSISDAFISYLERGKRTVSLPVLRKLVEFLKGDWPTAHVLWLEAIYDGPAPDSIAPESLSKLGRRRFERRHGRLFARPLGNGWRYREVRAGYEDKIPSLVERGYREVKACTPRVQSE